MKELFYIGLCLVFLSGLTKAADTGNHRSDTSNPDVIAPEPDERKPNEKASDALARILEQRIKNKLPFDDLELERAFGQEMDQLLAQLSELGVEGVDAEKYKGELSKLEKEFLALDPNDKESEKKGKEILDKIQEQHETLMGRVRDALTKKENESQEQLDATPYNNAISALDQAWRIRQNLFNAKKDNAVQRFNGLATVVADDPNNDTQVQCPNGVCSISSNKQPPKQSNVPSNVPNKVQTKDPGSSEPTNDANRLAARVAGGIAGSIPGAILGGPVGAAVGAAGGAILGNAAYDLINSVNQKPQVPNSIEYTNELVDMKPNPPQEPKEEPTKNPGKTEPKPNSQVTQTPPTNETRTGDIGGGGDSPAHKTSNDTGTAQPSVVDEGPTGSNSTETVNLPSMPNIDGSTPSHGRTPGTASGSEANANAVTRGKNSTPNTTAHSVSKKPSLASASPDQVGRAFTSGKANASAADNVTVSNNVTYNTAIPSTGNATGSFTNPDVFFASKAPETGAKNSLAEPNNLGTPQLGQPGPLPEPLVTGTQSTAAPTMRSIRRPSSIPQGSAAENYVSASPSVGETTPQAIAVANNDDSKTNYNYKSAKNDPYVNKMINPPSELVTPELDGPRQLAATGNLETGEVAMTSEEALVASGLPLQPSLQAAIETITNKSGASTPEKKVVQELMAGLIAIAQKPSTPVGEVPPSALAQFTEQVASGAGFSTEKTKLLKPKKNRLNGEQMAFAEATQQIGATDRLLRLLQSPQVQ